MEPRTAPEGARLSVEGEIPRAPCALDRPEYASIRFTPTGAVFEDLRGVPPEALRPAYEPYLGSEQPVSVVCEIRDRAAALLRQAGYVAAVEVPEQRIADGTIRFRVLQARLVGLRVRGDAGRAERIIAGYLGRLTEQEVFNRYEAERYLLLASDLPGYNVRLALRSAGTARGEVIGEVTVLRTRASADLTIQNYGSRQLGRWGGLARAQLFGLTGMGDRTTLSFFTTADFDEQQTLQVAHDFRLGGEGLTIGGQFTYAWGHPDLGDPAIDIRSRTLLATLEASYPFVRRQDQTLRGTLGFDFINQDVEFNDLDLNRDRLRVAYARLDYDWVGFDPGDLRYTLIEPNWRIGANAEFRQGLSIFDATEPCGQGLVNCLLPGVVPPSRLEGDPTGTVLRGGVYAEYRPVPRVTFAVGLRGQYSGDPLLSFEEYSGGNYTIGRGYDPGSILGDSGVGVQIELRIGSIIPRARDDLAVEPFVFFDHSRVWNEDVLGNPGRQELSSVGGGLRAAYGDKFRLEAFIAAPLQRTFLQAERGDPRFLVSFTTRLWPWSY
ncbi:ShlB/FhaC/HecB family hemolysin secretion/activation protein [Sphingosinicella sp. LHD-64]|uniref:ShlB/FhaC/HecB family hemolysin secretion/activation protein n=1 Tax=Sphingosinicella sp. LHD-64 TaxID=3072139 RepID=UPI00280C8BF0|nr:ShlB/FhaC/HecB family hemolysin secretion/activation protein [Sphingosinicella sp. LHD-64]MDQ8757210.1 ShlB/FhaC/HecB family hemolysin secretion/activation protein [Sphingosinicella sp. LHD-64]